MREWIMGFSNLYREQTGRRPVLYTNLHWWNDVVGDWTPVNSPLFLAAYQQDAPTTLPGRWWGWELWQYSDAGPFAGDSARWYGSEEQFERFVGEYDYGAAGICPGRSTVRTGRDREVAARAAVYPAPVTTEQNTPAPPHRSGRPAGAVYADRGSSHFDILLAAMVTVVVLSGIGAA